MLCRMINGQRMEPLEEVVCEIEDEFSGPVIDALSLRRGEVRLLQPSMQAVYLQNPCILLPSFPVPSMVTSAASDSLCSAPLWP